MKFEVSKNGEKIILNCGGKLVEYAMSVKDAKQLEHDLHDNLAQLAVDVEDEIGGD